MVHILTERFSESMEIRKTWSYISSRFNKTHATHKQTNTVPTSTREPIRVVLGILGDNRCRGMDAYTLSALYSVPSQMPCERDEAPDFQPDDATMCSLAGAAIHVRDRRLIIAEQWWNYGQQGKTEDTRINPFTAPLSLPRISH
jgi:hypothetical protein